MKEFFIKTKKRRWFFLRLLPALFIFAIIFFLLRGPYLSNSIKRVIIPVLEDATGERIITDHAVINLFPFYLQVKSIRVLDRGGNRLIWITKTRAYIDLFALLNGEIRVRRLTLKEPNITTSKKELQRIVKHIKRYLSSGSSQRFAFTLKGIKIIQGEFDLRDNGKLKRFSGRGLVANGLIKDGLVLDWSLKEGKLYLDGLSDLVCVMAGKIKVKRDGEIDVSNVDIESSDSELRAGGKLNFTPDGVFKGGRLEGDARIFVETVNTLFGVSESSGSRGEKVNKGREGDLRFSGSVDIRQGEKDKWPEFLFNLKTEGAFYLEDLMRLLKVKDTIKGRLSINGRIRGSYPDFTGEGRARLENALFDTLPLDDVIGEIEYRNRRFDLKSFIAHAYGGELRGDANLLIPRADYFVNAEVDGVHSKGFFEFIKWNAPFKEGIINGRFILKKIRGEDFDVVADVNYINKDVSEDNSVNRLNGIDGAIELKDKVVGIKDARFFTAASELFMDGRIDLMNKTLTLDLKLNSRDASDFLPYINGDMRFSGTAEGPLNNPEISGAIHMASGSIEDFYFDRLDSDLIYTINSLKLKSLNINKDDSSYDITGSILFREAEKPFSFNKPFFDVKVYMKDGDAEGLIKTFYYRKSTFGRKEIPLSGDVDGTLSFKGDRDRYTGKWNLQVKGVRFFGQDIDSADIEASFSEKGIDFHSLVLMRGMSELKGNGYLYPDESIEFSFTSSRLRLEDITRLQGYKVSATLNDLKLNASGPFTNPDIDFLISLQGGNLHGLQIKDGMIKGRMKNRAIHFNARFIKDLITVDGKVMVKRQPQWDVSMDFKRGDYGMLIKGLLKDVPEDLSLRLNGDVRLSGRGKKVTSMRLRFGSFALGLYRYSFTTKEDILINLDDERLDIKPVSLTGNKANVSISGWMDIGKRYDIKMNGDLNIEPLKALSDKISSLRGRGSFAVDISGGWERPDIAGRIDLKNITASIDGFPYMVGPLNGRLFFKKDRITLESLRGEIAGGRLEISGIGYLKGLSLKRVSITSRLDKITLSHIEGIRVVFDGGLFYEASSKGSLLTGDINIRKARYERRVEWKRWLLGLRETGGETTKGSSFFKDTSLNIHVSGSEDISVDNNILTAPVKVDLTVTGKIGRYGLIGGIETEGGSIYFRDNEFEIISGKVDFIEAEEIRPLFDIKAETFTSGYRIRLSLEGPVDRLALSMFSDPPLSENDILTLLTAGRISKEEKGFESGIAASEATAILTGGIQDVFEEKIKGIIGVERFEISPQTTLTGAVSPRVTVGKRLLNERLSVSYTTSIGTTEESIIRLKYRIGKKISIIGSRDELGSVGVDLNYRFEFK